MSDLQLATLPITQLKGVGAQLQAKLAKLNIHSIQDLLFHLPFRYQDRTRVTPIGAVTPNAEVVLEGEVRGADIVFGRRRSLVCKIQDNTGVITLRFFHFSSAQKQHLIPGTRIRCYGEVRRGTSGLELYHPEYEFLDGATNALEQTLTPIYPAAEGITQNRLRKIIQQALAMLDRTELDELLPTGLLELQGLPGNGSVTAALKFLHQPPADADLKQLADNQHPAQQRLIAEELLAHHISLLKLRLQHQQRQAPAIQAPAQTLEFPFPLTGAQHRVIAEILTELARPYPMLRLLQGDVGSGKTLVAATAAHAAVSAGYQAAIMAPTEILAEQLRNNIDSWLSPLGIKTVYLTGSVKGKGRQAQLALIADGQAQVIIGTHALFQDEVIYHNLGLVIIDEQHRFGVHQRLALSTKGTHGEQVPHQLIMTATPIPRTLAMSVYADLDCSIIDELPPGRQPVNTVLINNLRRQDVIERISNACASGRQCYWVCTLIEESDVLEAQAAEATADGLRLALPNIEIGLVHGRLKPAEKNKIMADFKAGDIQLLVATTVIEVGVDVPSANLMVIENPERLGLAQLHQLRGRVGRGQAASHCILMYQNPLSKTAKQRLAIMRETSDGFKIAAKDLELRGPGEVLGTRQTGEMVLKLADLQRDSYLLPLVQQTAERLLNEQSQQAEQLVVRWLGDKTRFAQA